MCVECKAFEPELIEGKVQCEACGRCKFIPDGEPANPRKYFYLSGLADFWHIFCRALAISPASGGEMSIPEISMIDSIGGEIAMEHDEFWNCVAHSVSYIRKYHMDQISKKMKEIK